MHLRKAIINENQIVNCSAIFGGINNYTMKASKGIGSIVLNGNKMLDNTEYGKGEDYIKIEGGVGIIEIKYL